MAADELILVDGVTDPDQADPCQVESCPHPGEILLGPDENLALCTGHAAELLLDLTHLRDIEDELQRQETVVLVLSHDELRDLRALLCYAGPDIEELREAKHIWLERIKLHLVPEPSVPDPPNPLEAGRPTERSE